MMSLSDGGMKIKRASKNLINAIQVPSLVGRSTVSLPLQPSRCPSLKGHSCGLRNDLHCVCMIACIFAGMVQQDEWRYSPSVDLGCQRLQSV